MANLSRAKPPSSKADDPVFLNVPYAVSFAPQFLAYICGVCAFGLIPRVTLEVQGGTRRLDRIVGLIESCRYAIHDMSWVVLDAIPPPTPRFNVPFELGLSVLHGMREPQDHTWFVFESTAFRIQKSLSDLNGTDPYIHWDEIEGVFRELAKAFVRTGRQPSVKQMRSLYDELTPVLPRILTDAAATDPSNARVFRDIVVFTKALAIPLRNAPNELDRSNCYKVYKPLGFSDASGLRKNLSRGNHHRVLIHLRNAKVTAQVQ